MVLMIVVNDFVGSVIGFFVFRIIVVGSVEVVIESLFCWWKFFVFFFLSSICIRWLVVVCFIFFCSNCLEGEREFGDIDGNCIFDIRDVKFMLDYLIE